VTVDMQPDSRNLLMRISFALGLVHLGGAHLLRAKANFPHLRFLGNVGWALFLVGMYGLVKTFVLKDPFAGTAFPHFLWCGAVLAILFAHPSRNLLKSLGLGLANFPLSAIGTFGDTVSYVRLMAVGLAGSALAVAFNDMALRAGSWMAAVPILILGHGLNIALCIVSLFAHGVRLNMLEFSSNLGMQWSGHPYKPFAAAVSQEN
jgi:V/A-type H+-transporting ATPase subunit I